jgi:indoleamine 2,3-dioxygenase
MLNVYPWLDYHYAYSLGNYVKRDAVGSLDWKNLDMACKFIGSQDEVGFIMLHVYINELSGQLVQSVLKSDLKRMGDIMTEMNTRRKEMWTASRHSRYNDFRIFIMGIKGNNDIFGEGLVYEDCFDNQPQQFRGQTGAQDNIIPTVDIFTGIIDYYPDNQLTEYLMDLRTYRPVCIQNFLSDLVSQHKQNNIFTHLKDKRDVEGLLDLLKIVDEVYFFRNGHWQFVQKYIMENTKYPKATGGTPITSWLVNQIEAVLKYEGDIIEAIRLINGEEADTHPLVQNYLKKVELLQRQVEEMNRGDGIDVQLIYLKNREFGLEDVKR